jgi:hypothetical protein
MLTLHMGKFLSIGALTEPCGTRHRMTAFLKHFTLSPVQSEGSPFAAQPSGIDV